MYVIKRIANPGMFGQSVKGQYLADSFGRTTLSPFDGMQFKSKQVAEDSRHGLNKPEFWKVVKQGNRIRSIRRF